MNILIISDSHKEIASSAEVNAAIERGLKKADPTICTSCIGLSDGGEGFCDVMRDNTNAVLITEMSVDALNRPKTAKRAMTADRTCIIESAQTCGLADIETNLRNPWHTTTFGLGLQIKNALTDGAEKIVIGLGGSATNDCGVGMLQALGYRFFDSQDSLIQNKAGGKDLIRIRRIEAPNLKLCPIIAACDVDNPLTGPRGCATVFAPQKGANATTVYELEKGAENFAKILAEFANKDVLSLKGGGAAGGLGAALSTVLNAELVSGINVVLQTVKLKEKIKAFDAIITGEGKTDNQTWGGKAVSGILNFAKENGIKCIVVSGRIESQVPDILFIESTPRDMTDLNEIRKNALDYIESCGERIISLCSAKANS